MTRRTHQFRILNSPVIKSLCINFLLLLKQFKIFTEFIARKKVFLFYFILMSGRAVKGNSTDLDRNVLHCFEKMNVKLSLKLWGRKKKFFFFFFKKHEFLSEALSYKLENCCTTLGNKTLLRF